MNRFDRIRARPGEALFAGMVGLFCAWAVLQSFVFSGRVVVQPAAAAVLVLGCVILPVLVSPSALIGRLGETSASFWGFGPVTAPLVRGAFYACIAIVWGIACVVVARRLQP